MGGVVVISTAVTVIVYDLISMTLNDSSMTIEISGILFFSSKTHGDWNEIEGLNVQRAGLLAIFGSYGDLISRTASVQARLKFGYCLRS
ncbi:hypothetical protein [Rhodococcus qingshengii]|uniref:hypothetical protein n=1 Tax=Rhodococcus qingshengii TaxID=334542 RepID=UPI001ABF426F|nr:hypothetical protein [Rhodococcus qingshengii]